jgi:DNA primase
MGGGVERTHTRDLKDQKDRFTKLRRQRRADERQGVDFDPMKYVELMILDDFLTMNYKHWKRNFPESGHVVNLILDLDPDLGLDEKIAAVADELRGQERPKYFNAETQIIRG